MMIERALDAGFEAEWTTGDGLYGQHAGLRCRLEARCMHYVMAVPMNQRAITPTRIAQRVAKDRILSVVDPEARHAHKSRAALRDGHKARIMGKPETGLFTSASITKAGGPGSGDAEAGIALLATDSSIPYQQRQHGQ